MTDSQVSRSTSEGLARDNRFVMDRLLADRAHIRAVLADRAAIGEKEEIRVVFDKASAFGAATAKQK